MKQIHNLPNRQSTRLREYDYSGLGIYFLTLCVEGREPLFGTIENGEMRLNSFGKIVAEEWVRSAEIRNNISMGEYIIMPDHFHGIIQIIQKNEKENTAKPGEFKSPSHSIGAIIRGFKGATTKRIKPSLFCTVEWYSLHPAKHLPQLESPIEEKDEQNSLLNSSQDCLPNEEELKILKRFNPNKSIWQRNYHDRIIRDAQHLGNTINYIIKNPSKWNK